MTTTIQKLADALRECQTAMNDYLNGKHFDLKAMRTATYFSNPIALAEQALKQYEAEQATENASTEDAMTKKTSLDAAIENLMDARKRTPNNRFERDIEEILGAARSHAASLREPLGNEGWRDIKDAPRDEKVRMMVIDAQGKIYLGNMFQFPNPMFGWQFTCAEYPFGHAVTHFQHLPSPPSTKPEEKEKT